MAKRRKSSHRKRHARRNPPTHATRRAQHRRRRSYRRNPPLFRGIIGETVQGVGDAVTIEAARGATNFIARMIPIASPIPAVLTRVAVATGIGVAARALLGKDRGRLALGAALSVPLESGIRAMNIPLISGALSSDEEISRYFRTIGLYPAASRTAAAGGRIGLYPPKRVGMGDGPGNTTMMTAAHASGSGYF